jgi:1-deoxy-D-xylulose-5-phosphate reductoisomerase
MRKRIIILGSTGSIGTSTLDIIRKDKKNFNIVLLTANNNYKKLAKQAIEFNVKNVLIYNKKFFEIVKSTLKKRNIRVFTGDVPINTIIKSKVDYSMSSIVGLAGLQPTIDVIKISKTVALANKETIICSWNILSKLIKKYKTKLLPVDSEHFSIMELTKNISDADIEEIIITASGGPFLKTPISQLSKKKPNEAIKHPNWKMGKKISIDSANLMNKVFEVIEAYNLFNFNKNKYKIMIHPQSYVHSIIRFKNGLIKMILYNSDMKIPISNTLDNKNNKFLNEKKINIKTLNKMSFQLVDRKKFPSVNFIPKCLNLGHSAPTIVNASNEILVELFLERKIGFLDIVKTINRIFKDKEFEKYATKQPKSVKEIKIIDNWARLKTLKMCAL